MSYSRLIGIKYPKVIPGRSGLFIDTLEGVSLKLASHIVDKQLSGKDLLQDIEEEAIREVKSDIMNLIHKGIQINKVISYSNKLRKNRTDDTYLFGDYVAMIEIQNHGDIFEQTRVDYIEFYSVSTT